MGPAILLLVVVGHDEGEGKHKTGKVLVVPWRESLEAIGLEG